MRRFLLLFVVAASLCSFGYAQTPGDGSSANSESADATPSDTQPTNPPTPPPVSLGDYARQLRLKKQQREAQLQQAKENKSNESQAKENQVQVPETSDKQTAAPPAQIADVKPAPQTSRPTPEPQAAAVTPAQLTPAVVPTTQPKPQIVTTAAVPTRATVTTASVRQTAPAVPQAEPVPTEAQVRQWKGEIQQQKSLVASLQQDITELNNSIHLAGGNCIANCDQWNDRQKQKKQDLETLKAQLQEQQGILAEMLAAERVLIPPSMQNSR